MKATLPFALAIALMSPRIVSAWGTLGHQTTGYLAMQFLDPTALSNVQSSLGSSFSNSLGPASAITREQNSGRTKYVRKGPSRLLRPNHFIDAHDNPPTSCSVDLTRDCGSSGCVVKAIQNYTTRLLNPNLDSTQHQQALLFITHFIGDVGQPLHCEAKSSGGNGISAKCSGSSSTNLHSVWGECRKRIVNITPVHVDDDGLLHPFLDTGIVTKNANALYGGSSQTYASALAARITSGEFSSLKSGWVSSINQAALTGTTVPLQWAQESNAYDCTVVFDFTQGQDLCSGTYYNDAVPVIDLQLAKQGYRLAIWLNTIFG